MKKGMLLLALVPVFYSLSLHAQSSSSAFSQKNMLVIGDTLATFPTNIRHKEERLLGVTTYPMKCHKETQAICEVQDGNTLSYYYKDASVSPYWHFVTEERIDGFIGFDGDESKLVILRQDDKPTITRYSLSPLFDFEKTVMTWKEYAGQ